MNNVISINKNTSNQYSKSYKYISVPFGTFMQWYDFSLFGALAVLISSTFFPSDNNINSLLNTFLVFAVGFILNPIGSVILGWVGDKFGRKKALSITIIGMAASTFFIGITPSYASIGIWATAAIVAFRLVQGFCSGTEFTNGATYLVEQSQSTKPTLMGCLTSVCYSWGSLAAALVATLLTVSALPSWAWRIGFLLSALGGMVVYGIRKKIPESIEYNQNNNHGTIWNSLKKAFQSDAKPIFTTFLIASTESIIAYGTYVWIITYLSISSKFALPTCILIGVTAMAVDAVLEPFIAYAIDKFKLRRDIISMCGMLLLAISSFKIIGLYGSGDVTLADMASLWIGVLIAIICAPLNALMVLSFKSETRCVGFGTSFNLGAAIFGGTTPLVLTYLYTHFGSSYVAMYFSVACIIGLFALMMLRSFGKSS